MTENIISNNIKYHRRRINLTQSALADKLFVTSQTISKWEKGLSYPTLDNLISLSELFNISIDALVKESAKKLNTGYIAIDGGGTKTEFVLFKDSGEVVKKLVLDGTNPNVVGSDKSFSTLKAGINILKATGFDIKGIFAGIAGCGAATNSREIIRLLKKEYPSYEFCVESDIFNVINGVRGIEKCIASICGTGVVTFSYDGEKLIQVGGWGYLFDYAGSGFDIGRDALRYALECETELIPSTILYDKIIKKHGSKISSSIPEIYKKGTDYIASFAPVVFDASRDGDENACMIIKKSATHLAALINAAYTKAEGLDTCIIAGGLTKNKDILKKYIKPNLNPDIKIVFPKYSQIYGAILKCMKLYGPKDYDEKEFDNNFEKSQSERIN